MNKVLIIVDVQNDFCPGGTLPVADADRIIPMINKLSNSGKFDQIIATEDWHPAGHISFASHFGDAPFTVREDVGMVWPDHAVQGTPGAELRPSLDIRPIQLIVRKGYRPDVDSYSAFIENDGKHYTGIDCLIEPDSDVYICGLATDYCVLNTAVDAKKFAFTNVYLITDAIAGVAPETSEAALKKMQDKGVLMITSSEILE